LSARGKKTHSDNGQEVAGADYEIQGSVLVRHEPIDSFSVVPPRKRGVPLKVERIKYLDLSLCLSGPGFHGRVAQLGWQV
jgi:hypothetical protein